jgi:hypothetical protein
MAELQQMHTRTKNELAQSLAGALQRQKQGHLRMQQQLQARLKATHSELQQVASERCHLEQRLLEDAEALADTKAAALQSYAHLNNTCQELQARLNSTWWELAQVSADRSRLQSQVRELESKVLMLAPLAAAQQAVRLCQALQELPPGRAVTDAHHVQAAVNVTHISHSSTAREAPLPKTPGVQAGQGGEVGQLPLLRSTQGAQSMQGAGSESVSSSGGNFDGLAFDLRRLVQHLASLLPDSSSHSDAPGFTEPAITSKVDDAKKTEIDRPDNGKPYHRRPAQALIALAGGSDSQGRGSALKAPNPGSGLTAAKTMVERQDRDTPSESSSGCRNGESKCTRGGGGWGGWRGWLAWLACFGVDR